MSVLCIIWLSKWTFATGRTITCQCQKCISKSNGKVTKWDFETSPKTYLCIERLTIVQMCIFSKISHVLNSATGMRKCIYTKNTLMVTKGAFMLNVEGRIKHNSCLKYII